MDLFLKIYTLFIKCTNAENNFINQNNYLETIIIWVN